MNILNSISLSINKAIAVSIKKICTPFNLWLLRKYPIESAHQRDVILILTASEDHNGALSIPTPIAFLKLHCQSNVKVVYKKVSQLNEISDAISLLKKQNNRIQGLWINAHGSSSGFCLGKTGNENVSNASYYRNGFYSGRGNADRLDASLKQLEPEATVVLKSCSSGKIDSLANRSIAQTFASLAPGRTIIAPTDDVSSMGSHFNWKKGKIDARFVNFKKSQKAGLFGKILNLAYIGLFIASWGRYGEEITARYCDHRSPIKRAAQAA